MMNVTARLAVRISNLPNFEFDWSDTEPQCSRDSLKVEDLLPSREDSHELRERARAFVMEFLVTNVPCLKPLEKFVPGKVPIHPVTKSEVMPMKILFKDEKLKDETIDILTELTKDANLLGDNHIGQYYIYMTTAFG